MTRTAAFGYEIDSRGAGHVVTDRPADYTVELLDGYARLPTRLAAHETGTGARLLQVVQGAGIQWRLARLWPGDRHRERALKRQGGASRSCPLCGIHPRPLGRAA